MILCNHADTGFLNETISCSRAGVHISSQRMTHSHYIMVLSSPSPKSSSLLWLQWLNQNLQCSSPQQEKWFLTAKPSWTWVDPNQKALSKWITLQPQGLSNNNNTKNYTSYTTLLYSIVLVRTRHLFTMPCREHSKIASILTHAIGQSHLSLWCYLIMV